MRENNVDAWEYLGENKVNGIEPIKLIKEKSELEEAKIYFQWSSNRFC